jgi:hypothetical protein
VVGSRPGAGRKHMALKGSQACPSTRMAVRLPLGEGEDAEPLASCHCDNRRWLVRRAESTSTQGVHVEILGWRGSGLLYGPRSFELLSKREPGANSRKMAAASRRRRRMHA